MGTSQKGQSSPIHEAVLKWDRRIPCVLLVNVRRNVVKTIFKGNPTSRGICSRMQPFFLRHGRTHSEANFNFKWKKKALSSQWPSYLSNFQDWRTSSNQTVQAGVSSHPLRGWLLLSELWNRHSCCKSVEVASKPKASCLGGHHAASDCRYSSI